MITHYGMDLVWGVRDILPLRGFPEGKVRIRMRPLRPVAVYVKPPGGGVREYVVTQQDGAWVMACEVGAYRVIEPEQRAGRESSPLTIGKRLGIICA